MPTYSDICNNYTADRSSYPASIQQQLTILEAYLYYLGGAGKGDPFDVDSRSYVHGIKATPELTEDPEFDPRTFDATFFTNFADGELIIKALANNQLISRVSNTNTRSHAAVEHRGELNMSSLLVSGWFVDFDRPVTTEGVRSYPFTELVCFKLSLIGEFKPVFLTPISFGTVPGGYSTGPLIEVPGFPVDYIFPPNNYGWIDDEEPIGRTPYWLTPGEGASQTLPLISPRKIIFHQWSFGIDTKSVKPENKRDA